MYPDYPELLRRVKTIIDLELNIEQDDLLNEIIHNLVQMVNVYVGSEELPNELDFIVVECAVARYLRRGSEGYESESMGEISINYEPIIESYLPYLDRYKSINHTVRFL